MDFFQAQDDARRRSRWLLVMFFAAVIVVVLASEFLVWGITSLIWPVIDGEPGPRSDAPLREILLATPFVIGGVILVGTAVKSLQLRGGGAVVAVDLGGRLVDPGTVDQEEKRLINIVEEMAIASGIPAPQVYVLDDSDGINAFAAGLEPSDAVIGVTRGCVQQLTRSELQGVVAHEFSHILNGDMRLNMRLIGFVFGLMAITLIGRLMLQSFRFGGGGNRRDGGGAIILMLLLLGLGLMIIGFAGAFCGRLIQAAISRQREFLADAAAVQFTRDPDGIAGALKKIGGQGRGSWVRGAKAIEASHMFFAHGGYFNFALATHPPLEKRIRAVDPGWDGEFVTASLQPLAHAVSPPPAAASMMNADSVVPVAMLDQIGEWGRTGWEEGKVLRDGLDPDWLEAAHSREGAQALVFALLLPRRKEPRQSVMPFLEQTVGGLAVERASEWQPRLEALHSAGKIALLDIAIPSLRRLSAPEYERFTAVTEHLIRSDGEIDLFEYMLQRVMARHLGGHFGRRPLPGIRYHRMEDLAGPANTIVSVMARLERGEEEAAGAMAAAAQLQTDGGWRPELLDPAECGPESLHEALGHFDEAAPPLKGELLRFAGLAAAHDGVLASREVEMLRAIADAIGGGVPPFVAELDEG